MSNELIVDLNTSVLKRISKFNENYKREILYKTHDNAMLHLFGLHDEHIKINLSEGKRINNSTRAVRQVLILGYTYDNNYWVLNSKSCKLCSYVIDYIKPFAEHKLKVKLFIDYPANYPFLPPQYKIHSIFNCLNNNSTLCKKLIYDMVQKFNCLDHGHRWSPITNVEKDILSLLVNYINLISKINIICLEN